MSARPMELDVAFRNEPVDAEPLWQNAEDRPNKRSARFGEDLIVWLEVLRRPGPPRTPWFPVSDADGGGWTFALSAYARGVGVTASFYAANWNEAQAEAVNKVREALAKMAAAIGAIDG